METIKQISKRTIVKFALLATIVTAISCSGQTLTEEGFDSVEVSTEAKNENSKGLKAGMTKTITSFDASLKQLPESIAIDHFGNIYLSMSPLREIWKLGPNGTFTEVVASFSLEPGLFGISGLDFDPRGNLYVAISSTNANMNGIWKINQEGEKERITGTGSILLPNDLAVLPNGTIYITDSAMGAVWLYEPGGQAEVWKQHESLEGTGAFGLGVPIGANGIVYVPGGKAKAVGAVIVANSEKGQVVSIPVLPDGSAGEEPKILIANPDALFGLDGITSDSKGNIYGAVNFLNKIVRISADGSDLTTLASGEPLDFPTSLSFGSGKGRHTLFISNFSVIHFLHNPTTIENAKPGVIALGVEP